MLCDRQAQWVEVKALAAGRTGADSLTLASGRQVWQGAGESCSSCRRHGAAAVCLGSCQSSQCDTHDRLHYIAALAATTPWAAAQSGLRSCAEGIGPLSSQAIVCVYVCICMLHLHVPLTYSRTLLTRCCTVCAGWPDFSPKPVLLMPAAKTLQLPTVCLSTDGSAPSDYTTSAQCVDTLRDPTSFCQSLHGASGGAFNKCMADAVYPDLYRAYKETLSSATTLFVLPGGHGTVTENPDMTVQQLVTKFAGV
jgi:hypothetical protein